MHDVGDSVSLYNCLGQQGDTGVSTWEWCWNHGGACGGIELCCSLILATSPIIRCQEEVACKRRLCDNASGCVPVLIFPTVCTSRPSLSLPLLSVSGSCTTRAIGRKVPISSYSAVWRHVKSSYCRLPYCWDCRYSTSSSIQGLHRPPRLVRPDGAKFSLFLSLTLRSSKIIIPVLYWAPLFTIRLTFAASLWRSLSTLVIWVLL